MRDAPAGSTARLILRTHGMNEWRIEWDEGNKQWLVIAPIGVVVVRTPQYEIAEAYLDEHRGVIS